jgi:hypothetical protein
MAHCPPELLDDLADVLAEVRTWAGVIEKKPNVFYVRRQPFLRFHLVEGGRRRADVKGRISWFQLDLPRPISSARRRTLLRALRTRYGEKSPRAVSVIRLARTRPSVQWESAAAYRPGSASNISLQRRQQK